MALCAGRTICKLHLPAPGLHADINGDGVMDHIQVHGASPDFSISILSFRTVYTTKPIRGLPGIASAEVTPMIAV